MNVLIACQESQRVCTAFRKKGHIAFSCDFQPTSGNNPQWHIKQDVLPLLGGNCTFVTCDGKEHSIQGRWDLIIAFPPCTYMSSAGACRMYPTKGVIDQERLKKAMQAKQFFMQLLNSDCQKVCVQNPRPLKVVGLPEKSQQIQPYQFGQPYSKLTYLWLKGLPHLKPTKIVQDYKPYVSCNTSRNKGNKDKAGASRKGGAAKARSKTFLGIAQAMAEQWG